MERFFTYTYEPETMPAGLFEYEQWITSRLLRNSTVGQENFNRWEFRHEFEYGVTDNYTLSLYINESLTNFREPDTHRHVSDLVWDGISLEKERDFDSLRQREDFKRLLAEVQARKK